MQFLSADLLCKSGEEQKREGAMADDKRGTAKTEIRKAENAQRSSHGQTKKNHNPPIMAFPRLALACKWMRK
jgi:hypothetical protein